MCNSMNHNPSCDCGFGGVYHGSSAKPKPKITAQEYARYNMNDVPNLFEVKCRCCGEITYFVRNTVNGGCFLSDTAGYPWSIHPCWERQPVSQKSMLRGVRRSFYLSKNGSPDTNSKVKLPIEGYIVKLIGGTSTQASLDCVTPDGKQFIIRMTTAQYKTVKGWVNKGKLLRFSGAILGQRSGNCLAKLACNKVEVV